ncbi:class I SAM-dependent methyltransferase [Streptomyces xylophagus]|uniref:class I SAM-dependent methyltransferase n=1 Tax=Streptomyces xylophagus TaxID=285514 RepID=UPI0005BDCC25|nr:class I SAM-dependent methyltransferase [Streptomyces xylophagus]
MTAQPVNKESWARYGQMQLDRGYVPPVPDRIRWGFWDGVGPGDGVLGPLRGKRVLAVGSGPGHDAVHLARAYGALVDAVELSPTQHQRAVRYFGDEPGVRFVQSDVVEHLRTAKPYDAAYATGTLACDDPHYLLPALRDGLGTGAPLVFSALHTNLHGHGPSPAVTPRQEMIRIRDQEPIPLQMWVLTPQLWEDVLVDYGFRVEAIDLLHAPDADDPVVVQLVRAHRTSPSLSPRD